MFSKILIANRGEIAVRIIRACRDLGISPVAIYSEADQAALHVRLADEAYLVGPPPSSESYLAIDRIVDAAKRCQAEAIHPGYGFLAENPAFARACADIGIPMVGPSADSIQLMGNKTEARAALLGFGVPLIPGMYRPLKSKEEAVLEAAGVGYPLMIKAAGGGGGKGMRLVEEEAAMPAACEAASSEALRAFGDPAIYLEKCLRPARHIEVQVLADRYGNAVHLGERECSLQRRHQKLLEESPSPFVGDDEDLRRRMGVVAVRAAQAVGYVNAGTIEFLVDKDKHFYFLEMNTRLQVEHPVTEMVTGVDIVKEQIRIARGRQLRYTQENIQLKGWAIECRINAEDPYNNFLPSTGHIAHILMPTGPGVRVDTGVYPGFEVSPYYDSLISKLIVQGETRAEAILRMRRALEEYKLVGVRTNIPFHQNLMDSHRYMGGQFDTRFVEERFSMETAESGREGFNEIAAIIATLVAHRQTQRAANIVQRGERDTSNWKWYGRWERMNR